MQKLPVYLYTNLFSVTLDLDNNRGFNQIMYQRPLKIQKGVKNTVQLQFKNSDQKLINISTGTFFLNVYEPNENKRLVISKPLTVLDAGSTATVYETKGLASVDITPQDTLGMDAKNYTFAIVRRENSGDISPTYANTYYDIAGTLELKEEIFPTPNPSIEVTTFQRVYNSTTLLWEYNSGNLRTYPDNQNRAGLITAAYYLNNFKGVVYLEGTLENSPGTFANYSIIDSQTYATNLSGIRYVNANGKFTHLRVRFVPASSVLDGIVPYPNGYLDKVLIRA